jgi:PAS domain S-box-containing protein
MNNKKHIFFFTFLLALNLLLISFFFSLNVQSKTLYALSIVMLGTLIGWFIISKKSNTSNSINEHDLMINEGFLVSKTDAKGKIIFANDTFCEISGYQREELIGSDHRILNSNYHPKAFFKEMWVTLQSGKPWKGEVKNKKKGGGYYWANTTILPIRDNDGNISEYISIRNDISKLKEVERLSNNVQEIANIGGWDLEIDTMQSNWTDQTYHIHEIEPGRTLDASEGINFYAEHEQPRIAQFVQDCIEKHIPFESDFEFITAKGNKRWVHSKGFPEVDKNGNLLRLFGTFQDVTEAKLNQKKIEEKESKLRALYEQSADAIMTIEPPTWGFTGCNPTTLKMFGVETEEDYLKLGPWNISPEFQPCGEPSGDKAKRMIMTAMETGYHWFEWTHCKVTGEEIPCIVLLSKIREGKKEYLQAIVRDITEQKQLEEELDKQKKFASHQAKLASIGELAAGVGHEINNPLAIIKGYVNSVQKKVDKGQCDPEYLQKYLGKIDIATNRIAKIVQGLRTFSRADSSETSDFSPIEALEESINMLQEIYDQDGINLEFLNNINDDIFINGNRGKFQQVLMNLIANAKDAVINNNDAHIKLACETKGSNLLITIKDNGNGIPEDIIEKIFDPFFTTKGVNKGTGIGLSLVHNFIKKLDGSMDVASKLGDGATFTITVPFFVNNSSSTQDIQPVVSTYDSYNGNILLVDDEEEIRNLLSDILKDLGMNVTTAVNGKEAFDLYTKDSSQFDAIITDMKMPVMDGPELIQSIRSKKDISQPGIILVTGGVNFNFEDKDNKLNQLIDGYFYKPFEDDKISEILNNILKDDQKKSA